MDIDKAYNLILSYYCPRMLRLSYLIKYPTSHFPIKKCKLRGERTCPRPHREYM